MSDDGSDRPTFDAAKAVALVGKTVLMGIKYLDTEGTLIERQQLYGPVVSADEQHGITVRLAGSRAGELFVLPPDLRFFEEARPGRYTLKSTGEVVESPDFLLTVSITRHAPER